MHCLIGCDLRNVRGEKDRSLIGLLGLKESLEIMPIVRRIVAVACFTLAGASVGWAEDIGGDAAAGQRLAEGTCRTCHQIDRAQAPVEGGGPAWQAIANMPSTTHLSLAVFLQSSHRNMPNLILTPGEIDDLVAYILSLKDGAAKP